MESERGSQASPDQFIEALAWFIALATLRLCLAHYKRNLTRVKLTYNLSSDPI